MRVLERFTLSHGGTAVLTDAYAVLAALEAHSAQDAERPTFTTTFRRT